MPSIDINHRLYESTYIKTQVRKLQREGPSARYGVWATPPGGALAGLSTGTAFGDASSVAKLWSATRSALLSLTSCRGTVRITVYASLSASLAHKHVR